MSEALPSATRAARTLPAAVIALGITSFFTDVASEMIFPLLPVFMASLGAAPAFLGLVEGLADATASSIKLASGYLADRSPARKPLVLLGYSVATVTRPLMALATAPWHVLAIRITDRVGKGIRASPRDVLIAASVPREEAGRAFGFHRAMDHAGAVVGPLVATALLGLGLELRTVFWLALVPGVVSVLAVLTVREPAVPAPAPSLITGKSSGNLSPTLRRYLAIVFVFSLGNSSDAFLLLRARELGLSLTTLPVLWTVFHGAKVVSAYIGGGWSDRIPRPKMIVAGWLVYAATYTGFAAATQPWHAWTLFIIYGSYYGLTEPAEKALVKELTPATLQGRAYGFYNFLVGISAIPAGVLTGWLWQTWSPAIALLTGAALATAASLALLVWSTRNVSGRID